jgi:uncharacterized caspase-like protein
VLLEPQNEISFPSGRRSLAVRIAGYASGATTLASVTANGQNVPFKREVQISTRKLGLANEVNRVSFEATITIGSDVSVVALEATDAAGNRTVMQIPVRAGDNNRIAEFRGRKYALIVGISQFKYQEGWISNLRYADADARLLAEFLQSPSGGRFPKENLRMLINEQATLQNFRGALDSFVSQPGPDDLLLVFLASHGGPDEQAPQNLYFIMHDTRRDQMTETALAMKDLQSLLQQNVRANRMVLLVDTCQSAGLIETPEVRTRGRFNNLSSLYAEKLIYQEEGKAIITAADVNEGSQESAKWGGGHGVFTWFLIEGMRGKADTNTDRLVTVGELFRFVRQKVNADTQFTQNPRMLLGTNENLALAAVTTAR